MNTVILAQIIGYFVTATTLVSQQLKNMTVISLLAIVSNALATASNFLNGGITGAAICAVAVAQSTIALVCVRKKRNVPVWVTGIFAALYVIIGFITYKQPLDLLPSVAALAFAFGIVQKKPSRYRILILINGLIWIVYELTLPIPNYAMAVTFILQSLSSIIGIIRLDIRRGK